MDSSEKELPTKILFRIVRDQFEKISPPRVLSPRKKLISLADCLMSGFAMFSLKYQSLLKFDEHLNGEDEAIKHNLKKLYFIENEVPSDTYLRERLDEVDPRSLRGVYKSVFASIQRSGWLKEYQYLDGHYLFSGDGTGFFSSSSTHCENCCIKRLNLCHVEFISKSLDDVSDDVKSKSYVLGKVENEPWELAYVDDAAEVGRIAISEIDGLSKLLGDNELVDLAKKKVESIKKLITAHYETRHPELAKEYYHQMYCGAIVHPDQKTVLPFAPPEPIMRCDGANKNDCERNASKRFFEDVRREHPHLKIIVIEDSLASNIPHLELLHALNMRYIIGAKPGDHKSLFDSVNQLVDKKSSLCQEIVTIEDGVTRRYRYVNNIQLNDSNPDFFVNFLEYWEQKPNEKEQHFSWVTDLAITNDNVCKIMRAARARWKIENEVFNTLKNQGYHFEHNFGHGAKHLSTVFANLLILCFFVDQLREAKCWLFQQALAKLKRRTYLWEDLRALFRNYLIDNWEIMYNGIIRKRAAIRLEFDSA